MPTLITLLLAINQIFSLSWTAPAPHRLQIRVWVGDTIREVAIGLQNEDYARFSAFQCDGRKAYWVEWRGVPGGSYDLGGVALDSQGKTVQSRVVRVTMP